MDLNIFSHLPHVFSPWFAKGKHYIEPGCLQQAFWCFQDKLLLFVENFDISLYHGWLMFRERNFAFASELVQVSIENVICRHELSVSNDTEIYVFFI